MEKQILCRDTIMICIIGYEAGAAWWMVDVVGSICIGKVSIYSRSDCCGEYNYINVALFKVWNITDYLID